MTLSAPETFVRAFANAWAVRDAKAIAALFAEDADFLTLTGHWAEGRKAVEETLAGEMAGAFARAKLVTGRTKLRMVAPGVAQLMQRYVLSGILNADGSDAGRVGAILSAVLVEGPQGWTVAAAQFTAEG
ncbi:SgcJ/EcaC family oxidoreductase [Defluviimonas sp. WL0024]|uniref:SgcJ/EcaC family oxidoreductase n=1 Tax=Albidovulum salinarum TaxID=2984153 RepID=A0ABT2X195_9RHOB|nr:SgcJ/EcaC family oxidoreductase [Defluviimonas sp. WL0024]MCU9847706.1 SgcJ/EcaC family oxidoreductase [Defluviimonas sp. WL0024]